jgi:hypothetical protein
MATEDDLAPINQAPWRRFFRSQEEQFVVPEEALPEAPVRHFGLFSTVPIEDQVSDGSDDTPG